MKRLILFVIFLVQISSAFAKEVNAIIRIAKEEQNDTLGYNLVEQLAQIMYFEVQSNRVKLWDSNKMTTEIQFSTLEDMERSAAIKFINIDNIFFYERWTLDKKNVVVSTLGILFATKNSRGEDITFGYIDYAEVEKLLTTRYMAANANGYTNVDMAKVLKLKRYSYSIVQYGRKLVNNVTLSEKYKTDVFSKRQLLTDAETIAPQKLVRYEIVKAPRSRDPKAEKGNALLDTVRAFFVRNLDVFYNLGGNGSQSHISGRDVNVTRIEVEEQWAKSEDKILYKPVWLTVYVDDIPMQSMVIEDVMEWRLMIYFSNIDRFLRDKLFNYSIIKINDQKIVAEKADAYQTALKNSSWTQLNQTVK